MNAQRLPGAVPEPQKFSAGELADLSDVVARQSRFMATFVWVLLALVVVWILSLFIFNPKLDLSYVTRFIFSPSILSGLGNTLLLALCAQVVAMVGGLIVGYFRLSRLRALRAAAWLYVWFFRSTPLLVQILFWGNLALFIPRIGWGDWSVSTNVVLTPFIASVIALGAHEAAYLGEVVRSGVQSVTVGQREAAAAIGLNWWQTQRFVILPQALRVMLPQFGSFFVLLLKSTSLVSVIGGGDLLSAAENIANSNYRIIELLIVATIWFLVVTNLASIGQAFLERRFSRQHRRAIVKKKGRQG